MSRIPLQLVKSLWFTRGWTLQELLAPAKEIFFAKDWTPLGDRAHMANRISDVTRIHIGALKDRSTIWNYSIAQRMSWAANRRTTRVEDIAYCLLGIFDIHMFMLYGEGTRAFRRLQEELIRISDDQSILAWEQFVPGPRNLLSDVLAPSPAHFHCCGSVARAKRFAGATGAPYSFTNFGVAIRLPIIPTKRNGLVLAGLNCARHLYMPGRNIASATDSGSRQFYTWIPLRHIEEQKFDRAHLPGSLIYLEQSCPLAINATPTDLFICATQSSFEIKLDIFGELKLIGSKSSARPSGFLVIIGAGEFDPQIQMYEEAYTLNNMVMFTMRGKSRLNISHEVIHHAGTTVVLSAFWGVNDEVESILSTAILDPGAGIARRILNDPAWKTASNSLHGNQSNTSADVDMLHSCLRRLQKHDNDTAPLIHIEKNVLVDSHDDPVIVSHINFKAIKT